MCTNYITTVRDEIRQRLDLEPPTFDYVPEHWPRYKDPMLIGDFRWRLAMFGLVPYFSKDGKEFARPTTPARRAPIRARPIAARGGAANSPWRRCSPSMPTGIR